MQIYAANAIRIVHWRVGKSLSNQLERYSVRLMASGYTAEKQQRTFARISHPIGFNKNVFVVRMGTHRRKIDNMRRAARIDILVAIDLPIIWQRITVRVDRGSTSNDF
ncbi:hypothetical protein SE17_01975 [Kouleothrix aurantiaca]|uniref:Uncharacterized protein n=1 Tax=Kouleothrix aurantiaca TaxID=186479 RepID=A0A0P9FDF7_9CHLR|nr:hypothetical protein SE17_01975 [Kouleothrix aurantiaca]